jgi:type I restriction enzyme, S subunit
MSGMNFLERLLDGVAVEWKPLGEICENISSGKNKDKSDVGIYPVFGSTGVIGRTNNKAYEKEQILVARVGVNAGHVNMAKGEYDVSDNTLIIQSKENIVLKYLYYYLVNINLNQFARGAGQPLITAGQLKTIKIPIPCPDNPEKSLAIQAEIVRILDTFTALTAELTAELTDRKKQYNYYRDLLLTFPKAEEQR